MSDDDKKNKLEGLTAEQKDRLARMAADFPGLTEGTDSSGDRPAEPNDGAIPILSDFLRLALQHKQQDEAADNIWQVHDAADRAGKASYVDPETGYQVFTRTGLLARGKCCGAGCRHCPFGHEHVIDKAAHIKQPAFLHRRAQTARETSLLFWSSGKDSFLTLRHWLRQRIEAGLPLSGALDRVTLVTTFDGSSRTIAHQEVEIARAARQAQALDVSHVAVPLFPGKDYLTTVMQAKELVTSEANTTIRELVFGDLHLEHIRSWREDELGKLATPLAFPLWHVAYEDLFEELLSTRVPCTVSASLHQDVVRVGELFDAGLYQRLLAADLDGFGENGEFHTYADVAADTADPFHRLKP